MEKIYGLKVKTALSFYVMVDGKPHSVRFTNYDKTLGVKDVNIQKAIESSERFKNGEIVILNENSKESKSGEGGKIKEKSSAEKKEYPEVTDINEAIAILKNEYKVSAKKLTSVDGVKEQIDVNNLSFPNVSF